MDHFKAACASGDITAVCQMVDTLRDDDSVHDDFVHEGLQLALQHGRYELVKFILVNKKKTFFLPPSVIGYGTNKKSKVQNCVSLFETTCCLAAQQNGDQNGDRNDAVDHLNDLLTILETLILEAPIMSVDESATRLLYCAFLYNREHLFTTLLSQWSSRHLVTQKSVLTRLFEIACSQGDLECVCAIYNNITMIGLSSYDYHALMYDGLSNAVDNCHDSVVMQLFAWRPQWNMIATLQSFFDHACKITTLQCLNRFLATV